MWLVLTNQCFILALLMTSAPELPKHCPTWLIVSWVPCSNTALAAEKMKRNRVIKGGTKVGLWEENVGKQFQVATVLIGFHDFSSFFPPISCDTLATLPPPPVQFFMFWFFSPASFSGKRQVLSLHELDDVGGDVVVGVNGTRSSKLAKIFSPSKSLFLFVFDCFSFCAT